MGLDLTTYAMIVEELSRGWISISGVVNTHFIGSYLLMKFGTDEQKELLPAEDGHRRDPRRLLALRARGRLRRPGRSRRPPRRTATATGSSTARRCGSPTASAPASSSCSMKTDPKADPPHKGMTCFITEKEPWRDENTGEFAGLDVPPQDQEDGLQGRRVDRAGLRRLPLPGRADPRRRGGRARQGLRADDGRARGRPRQRRRPRRRHRPARARAGAPLQPGAQDVRQADRPAPGDPVQARRHGDQDRGGAAADAARPPG